MVEKEVQSRMCGLGLKLDSPQDVASRGGADTLTVIARMSMKQRLKRMKMLLRKRGCFSNSINMKKTVMM